MMKVLTLVGSVACAGATTVAPITVTRTETFTVTATKAAGPYDSSSGVGGNSLGSVASGSLELGDMSDSNASLGSYDSGSSGFNMGILLWCLVAAACCAAAAAVGASVKKPKKKTVKKKAAPAAPAAAPVEEAIVLEPLLVPQLMPMATTTYAAPQYSMVAAPELMPMATTTYAAPQYSVAAPQYAPQYGYAGVPQSVAYPGTVSYAAPGQVV